MDVPRLLLALLATLLLLPGSAGAVTGGRDASRPYPYMVALEYDPPGSEGFYQACGASLVSSEYVLTAAHCLIDDRDGDGEFDDIVPPSAIRFLIGTERLDERESGETIGAAQLIVHEKFLEDEDSSHDVGLVRLARPATKGGPIRLASPTSERSLWAPGTPATVTGWGTAVFQDPGLTASNQLQEVQLPVRADEECDENYGLMGGIDEETMVCAGELQGGKDACQGDSGGPLVVAGPAGALLQVGVVSWGFGCGFPTQYGVYSRVADTTLYGWITARVPQPSAPPASSGSTTDGGGAGGDAPAGGSTGPAPGPAPSGSAPSESRRGSARFRRCMRRANRVPSARGRRIATLRCQYAESRRVAYRRCVRRARRQDTARQRSRAIRRCKASRRAAARRHERALRRA